LGRNPPVGTAPTSPVDCRSERRRSTGGMTLGSTGSRPSGDASECNSAASVGFPASGETITSTTSRRIPTGIAGLEGAGCPINLRGYRWGRRRSRRGDPDFCGRQRVTSCRIQDPADFCSKMAGGFGAEVYRKSTGVSVKGKSSGNARTQ
jgi:hypothetical protein